MANDPPSNLRMGFGYHQARAAGLGGLRQDKSPRQVNREISDRRITTGDVVSFLGVRGQVGSLELEAAMDHCSESNKV
jgi:hypothetical protein